MKRKQERKAQDPHARRTSIEKRDDFNLSSKLESLLKYLALCPRDARKLLSDVKPFLNEDALARMEKSVRFFFFFAHNRPSHTKPITYMFETFK